MDKTPKSDKLLSRVDRNNHRIVQNIREKLYSKPTFLILEKISHVCL